MDDCVHVDFRATVHDDDCPRDSLPLMVKLRTELLKATPTKQFSEIGNFRIAQEKCV